MTTHKFYDQNGIEIPQQYWMQIWKSGVPAIHETDLRLSNNRLLITTIWMGLDPEPEELGPFDRPRIFQTIAIKSGEKLHMHFHPTADEAMMCHYGVMTSQYPRFFRHREWLRVVYRNANRVYSGVRWPYSVKFARIEIAMWMFICLLGWGTFIPPYHWVDLIFAPLYLLYGWMAVTAIRGLKFAKSEQKKKDEQAKHDEAFESIMSKEYGNDARGD